MTEITLQTLNRRLQKAQFILQSYEKQRKELKKNQQDLKMINRKLEQRIQIVEKITKKNDQELFQQKKEIQTLKDSNKSFHRANEDLRVMLQNIINTPSNQTKNNMETNKQQQNNKNKKIENDKMEEYINTLNMKELKISSGMNMNSQWAKENFKINLQFGFKAIQKISQSKGLEMTQLCGLQQFSKHGVSYYMVNIIRSNSCNINIGVISQQGKSNKNDERNSIVYKANKGQIQSRKSLKKCGKKIQVGQIVCVMVNRQLKMISWLSDDVLLASSEIPQQFATAHLYPKIQIHSNGDIVQLL